MRRAEALKQLASGKGGKTCRNNIEYNLEGAVILARDEI